MDAEMGARPEISDDLPAGLAELLLARLQRLSPAGQQVVHAAAVAGRRVEDDLVRQACGLEEPEYEQAVREAVANQLLVPDGEEGYAFRHALLREAAYGDLLPGERTRLHARLAELLSDEVRLSSVPGTAAELAHHSLASHDMGLMLGLKGFVAAVMGGLVSAPGAVASAFLLGVLESLGAGLVSSGYKDALAFVILIAVLFLRPQGLIVSSVKRV